MIDLAHGLETKWSNFRDYLQNFNEELSNHVLV